MSRLLRRQATRLALVILMLMVLLAIFAPWVCHYPPMTGGDNALLSPLSSGHWLGTDDLCRDIWSRVV